MSYTHELDLLRNRIEKSLVHEAVSNCPEEGGVVLLNSPIDIITCSGVIQKESIIGFDCDTGIPVNKHEDFVYYHQINITDLANIHHTLVENKNYTTKPDLFI